MNPTSRENLGVFLVVVVLGASLAANAVQFASGSNRKGARNGAGFKADASMPMLLGKDRRGADVQIDFKTPTIMYVFSPNCGWCRRDHQNIVALAASLRGQYRIVSVALSNGKAPVEFHRAMGEYLTQFPSPGETILLDPDHQEQEIAKAMRLTPQTLVITNGQVERVWVGALMDKRLREANEFFGLELPGVVAEGLEK